MKKIIFLFVIVAMFVFPLSALANDCAGTVDPCDYDHPCNKRGAGISWNPCDKVYDYPEDDAREGTANQKDNGGNDNVNFQSSWGQEDSNINFQVGH